MVPVAITVDKGAAVWGKLEINAKESGWVKSCLYEVKYVVTAHSQSVKKILTLWYFFHLKSVEKYGLFHSN